jgi:hypothetical protein
MYLWLIYILLRRSAYFSAAKDADCSWEYIHRSQIHECRTGNEARAVLFLGIQKSDFWYSVYTESRKSYHLQSLGLAMPVKRDGLYLHGNVSPSFYHYQVGPLHRGVICAHARLLLGSHHRHKVHIYLEYHSVCPHVRIGIPCTLTQASCVPPPEPKGERTHSLAGEGPNSYDRRKSLVLCIPVVPDHRGAESYDDHKEACMAFQNSLKLSSNKHGKCWFYKIQICGTG